MYRSGCTTEPVDDDQLAGPTDRLSVIGERPLVGRKQMVVGWVAQRRFVDQAGCIRWLISPMFAVARKSEFFNDLSDLHALVKS
ncbi:hypothetical protein [Dokdonella sp.]|uniref:hypothetical protein n=1 Tax=Dokdonella sp. TaxID=2291710 RepID=UPI0027BB12B5|nr:hypothetical protein [Dokdonella sp.]